MANIQYQKKKKKLFNNAVVEVIIVAWKLAFEKKHKKTYDHRRSFELTCYYC